MNINSSIEAIANRLDSDSAYIYLGKNINLNDHVNKSVMLVSHMLTRTGAPTVLLEAAKAFKQNDVSVWLLCSIDGELRESFIEEGINVIIHPHYATDNQWFNDSLKIFNLWIINTLTLVDDFSRLNSTSENIIWWIHENEYWFNHFKESIHSIKLGEHSKILAAGPYVKDMIKKYMHLDVDILNFYIEDIGRCPHKTDYNKVIFLHAATIDGLKGQGILCDAINLLDSDIMSKCEFIFCGNTENANIYELSKIYNTLCKYRNVKLIPQLSREDLYKLYDDIDAVIVPSIVEPTSAVMVEIMMKGKFGICSDVCGIARYLEDGKSGFVFKTQDSQALADKISYVVNNINISTTIGDEARKVYEHIYSKDIFMQRIITYLYP